MGRHRRELACSHDGCAEHSFRVFGTAREHREDYRRQPEWRCGRHAHPSEVLAPESLARTTVYEARRVLYRPDASRVRYLDGLFWLAPGAESGGCGVVHGPGFKAYADDFPEGTRIEVTARVILPEATDA